VKEKDIQNSSNPLGVWDDVGGGVAMVLAVGAGPAAKYLYDTKFAEVLDDRVWTQLLRIGRRYLAGETYEDVAATEMGADAMVESIGMVDVLEEMTAVELSTFAGVALIGVQAAAFLGYGIYLLIRRAEERNTV